MKPYRDAALYNQAKSAVATLVSHYRYGAYRVIKDPDGIVSLWAIEGNAKAPFSISFVNKGRVYSNIDDVPQDFLKPFLECVRKSIR